MREYLLKRVLLIVPTLFLVTILVFLLMRMRSGDVVIQMLEGYAYADTVEALRRELGLDKPLYEQYLAWMGGVLRGDLGRSLWTKESILVEFARRFPVTLELTLLTYHLKNSWLKTLAMTAILNLEINRYQAVVFTQGPGS